MKKLYFILILIFVSYNSYSQLSLSSTANGVVSVSYGASGDWTLYDPQAETVILYLWVDTGMNSLNNYYQDEWTNAASLVTLTWDGTAHAGTIDLNTHDFTNSGGVIPTGTTVTDFNLILRNPAGDRQSANLLASNYGYANSTLPVDEFTQNSISINLIENTIQIEGLAYNQKFKLDVYDLSGKLIKKMNEKSKLNLNELTSSIYILKLKVGNTSIGKKVLKK